VFQRAELIGCEACGLGLAQHPMAQECSVGVALWRLCFWWKMKRSYA
jgi:hypothetical protein